jgi:uncharacterized cupredoxin-like copper-binding protein
MRHKFVLFGVGAIVLFSSGCGGAHRDGAPVVIVTERDFRIQAPKTFPSGTVRLVVRNKGPVSHELLIFRASPGRLPRRADGFTIDEDALHNRLVKAVDPQRAGAETSVVIRLSPGRYLLLCNMTGHAAGGMLMSFRVR